MFSPLNRFITLACLLGLAAFWFGCAEDDESPTSPAEPVEVSWFTTLPNLVFETEKYYPVIISISGVNPEKVDSVKGFIQDDATQPIAEFYLYDDAGYYEHDDAADTLFCSAYSGDLVANNGVFSRLVNSGFAAAAGNYQIQVKAWFDGDSAQSEKDTVIVALSLPPELSALDFPDTLESGFAPVQISLQALDPDDPDVDSVTAVLMTLYSPGNVELGDPVPLEALGSGHYGTLLTPDLAVANPSGNYTFVFRATDTFNVLSDSLGKQVYMENLAPHLSDLTLPDTVVLPTAPDTASFPISSRCWDDQTAEDITQVNIRALKPDSTWGTFVELFDDGDVGYSGDVAEGDSIYTRIVSIYPTNDLGLYQFYFRAEDKAGNQTEIVDSLWVVP